MRCAVSTPGFDAQCIGNCIGVGADGASHVRKSLNGRKNGWFNVRNPDMIVDWIEIVLWATVSFPLTVTSHLFSGLRAASQAVCPAPARVAANSAGISPERRCVRTTMKVAAQPRYLTLLKPYQ
jgi:hypothetical protein